MKRYRSTRVHLSYCSLCSSAVWLQPTARKTRGAIEPLLFKLREKQESSWLGGKVQELLACGEWQRRGLGGSVWLKSAPR